MTPQVPRLLAASIASCLALGGAIATPAARATPLPAYPTAASGPSTTAWYPDRYVPAGFANAGTLFARDNVLGIDLASTDSQSSRPAGFNTGFYNTQGRKVDVALNGPVSWIGSLYLPASWGTPTTTDASGSRRSDLWATLSPATGGDTCPSSNCNLFPIIGFSNAVFPDADGAVGGTPRFRVFDGNNGGWNDLATPVAYDRWADFCVSFTPTAIEYRIGETLVYTATNITQADTSFGPPTQLANVMAQAYNYGAGYSANWSRVAAGQATCAELRAEFAPPTPWTPPQPVPVGPFAPLLSALAIAFACIARHRISRRR